MFFFLSTCLDNKINSHKKSCIDYRNPYSSILVLYSRHIFAVVDSGVARICCGEGQSWKVGHGPFSGPEVLFQDLRRDEIRG